MNQNPIDNDLQKAIEDITNNTNNDPVFGDPVAAPEPTPAPEPMAPMGPLPEAGMPAMPEMPEMPAAPEPMPEPIAEPEAPVQKPIMDFRPNPASGPVPVAPVQDIVPPRPEPIAEAISEQKAELEEEKKEEAKEDYKESEPITGELSEVKESILRDLAPMVDKMDMDPSKKFGIYKDIHEKLHDDSVIASAYEVSKEIADDGERADALLYLYDSLK